MLSLLLIVACTSSDPVPGEEDTDLESDVHTDTAQPVTWPDTLSATGLYADIAAGTLAEDVVRYDVAWPLWSDGAAKERFIALPPGTTIDTSDPNHWVFPVGTRAWKSFTVDGTRVETRFIEHTDLGWSWVAYQWRDDQLDADPVPDGVTDASATPHDIPATGDCRHCHDGSGLIGPDPIQLGADNDDDVLATWVAKGSISHPIDASTAVPGTGVTREALGYLHGNCSSCHDEAHPLADKFDLRLEIEVGLTDPAESLTYTTSIDTPTRHQTTTAVVVAPGDPEASQLWERMGLRDLNQMPPIGTEVVDQQALATVGAWITSLE